MKKLLWLLVVMACNIGVVGAYVTIDENDAYQIEEQINSTVDLTQSQKKEKSKLFYKIARKSYEICKVFVGGINTVPDVELTDQDWDNIKKRIEVLKKLKGNKKTQILNQLKSNQYVAKEIGRLYEIESYDTFQGYGRALTATPVFQLPRDNPNINEIMGGPGTSGMRLDASNLIREVIVVYPKDTVFSLVRKHMKGNFTYYEIRTNEFDGITSETHSYYIDSRFVEVTKEMPHQTIPRLPSAEQILLNMHNAIGSTYVWGGTYYQGIPELASYFPSNTQLDNNHLKQKTLKGVDCSGLLYQATKGYTPRNSHGLLSYGKPVEVEGLTINQIAQKLRPLDLIVWGGHVIIVYDATHVIESRWYANFKGGVMMTNTQERLKEIMETRQPVNDWYSSKKASTEKFVVRRWYGIS